MDVDAILSNLKNQRDRLEAAISALEGAGNKTGRKKGKRTMSPAARAKIAAAARKRWAAARKAGKATLAN